MLYITEIYRLRARVEWVAPNQDFKVTESEVSFYDVIDWDWNER